MSKFAIVVWVALNAYAGRELALLVAHRAVLQPSPCSTNKHTMARVGRVALASPRLRLWVQLRWSASLERPATAMAAYRRIPPVHVFACATEYRQETAILWRSATRNGFIFHPVGVGEPWRGFATKFLAYERSLQGLIHSNEIRPDDTVMLMDAWDTVILGGVDEFLDKIAGLPSEAVLCGAERVCGPNHFLVAQIEALFPDGRTPWRYPNSGGLVGSAEAMIKLLHGLINDMDDGSVLDASDNDQVRLHDYLIARANSGSPVPFVLDLDCRIFQCMYEEQPQWDAVFDAGGEQPKPRMVNRLTGERPVVAHGNGHTGRWFLSALYCELRLLEYLGLTMDELAHLKHEMPVAPGTLVTEDIKAKYCPWWYEPGLHKGATDGFATFRMLRSMLCEGKT